MRLLTIQRGALATNRDGPNCGGFLMRKTCAHHVRQMAHEVRRLTYGQALLVVRILRNAGAFLMGNQLLRSCPHIRMRTFCRILSYSAIQNDSHCVITVGMVLQIGIISQFLEHSFLRQNPT